MKVNPFMTIISLLIGALVFFIFYKISDEWLISLVNILLPTIALAFALGVSFVNRPRITTIIKMISGIFFTALLFINIGLYLFSVDISTYIIVDGLISIGGIISIYTIAKSKL